MTEPVKMSKLGGLYYQANQVSSAKRLGNGNYEIVFKTGEKLEYPEQKPKVLEKETGLKNTKPSIFLKKVDKGVFYDDTHFDISNVMGATFSSSKESVTHVNLNDSFRTTLYMAANNSKVFGDEAKITGGVNNKLKLDKKDKADINGLKLEEPHYTEYTQTSETKGGTFR